MHKDKRALVETLRKYQRHILGPLFTEAADTIETLLNEREEREKPDYWIMLAVTDDNLDPAGVFRHRFKCPKCGSWQSYGITPYCPNCGKPLRVNKTTEESNNEKENG